MFATGIVSSVIKGYSDNLVIPRSSVLWTGKRSIVYVKQTGSGSPAFKMREIENGPMLGDSYVVSTENNYHSMFICFQSAEFYLSYFFEISFLYYRA